MEDWVNKISFHAKLPPSLQLMSYDESQKDGFNASQTSSRDHPEDALSTGSSHASTPEMERKNSVIRRDVPISPNKAQSDYQQPQSLHHLPHQHHHLPQQMHNISPQQLQNKKRQEPSPLTRTPPDAQPQKEFLQMYMQQQQQQQQQFHHQHHLTPQSRQHIQESHYVNHPIDKPPIPPRGAPPPVPARSPSFENSVPLRRNGTLNYMHEHIYTFT